jgi:acetolactate synthase-1/3 small subunit
MTGSSSKIEGLIQVITESGYIILEVSRTGRMAMRRGHHTSRVLKALGTPDPNNPNQHDLPKKIDAGEILPNQFADHYEHEDE